HHRSRSGTDPPALHGGAGCEDVGRTLPRLRRMSLRPFPLWERALRDSPSLMTGEGSDPSLILFHCNAAATLSHKGRGPMWWRFRSRKRGEAGYFFPPSNIPAIIAIRTRSDRLFADIFVMRLAR